MLIIKVIERSQCHLDIAKHMTPAPEAAFHTWPPSQFDLQLGRWKSNQKFFFLKKNFMEKDSEVGKRGLKRVEGLVLSKLKFGVENLLTRVA